MKTKQKFKIGDKVKIKNKSSKPIINGIIKSTKEQEDRIMGRISIEYVFIRYYLVVGENSSLNMPEEEIELGQFTEKDLSEQRRDRLKDFKKTTKKPLYKEGDRVVSDRYCGIKIFVIESISHDNDGWLYNYKTLEDRVESIPEYYIVGLEKDIWTHVLDQE